MARISPVSDPNEDVRETRMTTPLGRDELEPGSGDRRTGAAQAARDAGGVIPLVRRDSPPRVGVEARPQRRRTDAARRRLPSYMRVFGMNVRTPALVLGVFEFALFYLTAQFLSDLIASRTVGLTLAFDDVRALLVAAAMSGSAVAMGLYSPAIQFRETRLLARCLVAFAALAPGLWYLGDLILPLPPVHAGVLAGTALVATVSAQLLRSFLLALFNDRIFQRRVTVLGAGREAARIGQRMRRRADRRGFELLAYVDAGGPRAIPERETVPIVTLEGLDLREYCRQHDVHEIVVAMDDRRRGGNTGPLPLDSLLDCRMSGVQVTELVTFIEREAGRIDIDILRPSWLLFSEGFSQPLKRGFKRALDLLSAGLLLGVSWPFMLATAMAIKLEDGRGAPVFYRQQRVGLDGRRFDVVKFRSMRTDAEKFGAAQWAERDDPRITRVGRTIRTLRVDELPQILNVLRGEMSLVGPRPERPVFVERFCEEIAFYGDRHRVKPGLTGWAQLNYPYGSSEEDARRKLEFDLYYVKNYSLVLDLMILIRTIEVVLFGRGAR